MVVKASNSIDAFLAAGSASSGYTYRPLNDSSM